MKATIIAMVIALAMLATPALAVRLDAQYYVADDVQCETTFATSGRDWTTETWHLSSLKGQEVSSAMLCLYLAGTEDGGMSDNDYVAYSTSWDSPSQITVSSWSSMQLISPPDSGNFAITGNYWCADVTNSVQACADEGHDYCAIMIYDPDWPVLGLAVGGCNDNYWNRIGYGGGVNYYNPIEDYGNLGKFSYMEVTATAQQPPQEPPEEEPKNPPQDNPPEGNPPQDNPPQDNPDGTPEIPDPATLLQQLQAFISGIMASIQGWLCSALNLCLTQGG